MEGEEGAADQISELSLQKIGELMKSGDPPLSKVLLVRLVLLKTYKDLEDKEEEPDRPLTIKATGGSLTRGLMEYISSGVGQTFAFIHNLRKNKTDGNKEFENECKKMFGSVRYEELMGIRSAGNIAREIRFAEEEKMRKDWRLAQERGKRTLSPKQNLSLKRDPSAELIKEIVNPTLLEKIPPDRFLRTSRH